MSKSFGDDFFPCLKEILQTNGDEFVSKVDDLLMIDGKLFDGENNGQTTVPQLDYDRVD